MLKKAGTTAPRVPEVVVNGSIAFGEIMANIIQQYSSADEIGKKAAEHKGEDHPGKVLLRFNDSPRKELDDLLKAIYGEKWEKEKGKKTEHKLKKKLRKGKKDRECQSIGSFALKKPELNLDTKKKRTHHAHLV